jgi:WD40 repeat protein
VTVIFSSGGPLPVKTYLAECVRKLKTRAAFSSRLALILLVIAIACVFVGLLCVMLPYLAGAGRGQTAVAPAVQPVPAGQAEAKPEVPQPAALSPQKPQEALKLPGLSIADEKTLGAMFFPGSPFLLIVNPFPVIVNRKDKYSALQLPEGQPVREMPPGTKAFDLVGVEGYRLIGGDDVYRLLRLQDGNIAGPNADDEFKRDMSAITPDGRRLVTYNPASDKVHVYDRPFPSSQSNPVRHWDVGRGKRVVTGMDVDPRGLTIAVAFADGPLEFRDIATGALRFRGNVPGVSGFCRPVFSPNGKALAAPSYSSSRVAILDLNSESVKGVLSGGSDRPAWTVVFSPDGQKLATGSLDGKIHLYDIASARPLARLRIDPTPAGGKPAEQQMITSLSISSDGRFLAATDPNATHVWDVGGFLGAPLPPAPLFLVPPLSGRLDPTPDNPPAPTPAKPAPTAAGAPTEDATTATQMPPDRHAFTLSVAPDGKTVALAIRGGISLWDLAGQRERGLIPIDGGGIPALSFSPDGRSLLFGDPLGKVGLWDVADRSLRQSFKVPVSRARCVRLSPDGRTAAAAGFGGVRTWDVETGRSNDFASDEKAPFLETPLFEALAFAPDGKTLAAGGVRTPIVLLDVASGRLIAKLSSRTPVSALAFSPDGQTLASGGADLKVLLWDVAKAAAKELPAQSSLAQVLAFSPDGRRLLVISLTHLWVWDLISDGILDQRAARFGMAVGATPDDWLVVSAGNDNVLRTWNLTRSPAGGPAP